MGTPVSVCAKERSETPELVFAKDADDAALNLYIVRSHHNRSQFGICRLQAYLAGTFAIEALERCFLASDQSHNDVPGIGHLGVLANNKVPIHNVIFNHGCAFDLQDKGIAATREVAQRNRLAL